MTTSTLALTSKEVAAELYHLSVRANYEHERIPVKTVRQWAGRYWGQAGLALAMCANWGFRPSPSAKAPLPEDPAGRDWLGTSRKSGKHWADGGSRFPWGGLGLPHYDSSSLARVYDHFGAPRGVSVWAGTGKPKLYAEVGSNPKWRAWAEDLLSSPGWGEWMLDDWARRYYQPAFEEYVAPLFREYHPAEKDAEAIGLAVCWSRIANSGRGTAKAILGERDPEKMLAAYVAGRPSSEERRTRQFNYARRVGVLLADILLPEVAE